MSTLNKACLIENKYSVISNPYETNAMSSLSRLASWSLIRSRSRATFAFDITIVHVRRVACKRPHHSKQSSKTFPQVISATSFLEEDVLRGIRQNLPQKKTR